MSKDLVKYVRHNHPKLKGKWERVVVFGPYKRIYMSELLKLPDKKQFHDALLAHAMVHIRQADNWLHPLFYRWSKAYRFQAEAEGYAVSQKLQPNLISYANEISKNYGLTVTIEEAKAAIKKELSKISVGS